MSQATSLTPIDLRRVLTRLFDEEELRTLCFDLGVDYDGLRGEGKAARARELVALAERTGRLAELEAAVRHERPTLETIYSPERTEELRDSILGAAGPRLRAAFVEFNQQIEAYLNEFNRLHDRLAEWKEVHNLLQELQINFAPCRSRIGALGEVAGVGRAMSRQQERVLYETEVEWRPCKRTIYKLQELAATLQSIGEPYDAAANSGPDWFLSVKTLEAQIDRALFDQDAATLAEHLSAFADQVDRDLYLADRSLREVVGQINRLPRPSLFR